MIRRTILLMSHLWNILKPGLIFIKNKNKVHYGTSTQTPESVLMILMQILTGFVWTQYCTKVKHTNFNTCVGCHIISSWSLNLLTLSERGKKSTYLETLRLYSSFKTNPHEKDKARRIFSRKHYSSSSQSSPQTSWIWIRNANPQALPQNNSICKLRKLWG